MMRQVKKYILFLVVIVADVILWIYLPDRGTAAVAATTDYLVELLLFVPPIFILVGLLDVWVPRKIVEQYVGPESGVKGIIISIMVATAAAGPLYAGFPVAYSLLKKGSRIANVVIFLSTWATIKIPMLMMEIKFMGLDFALARLLLTVPAIVLTGFAMERIISKEMQAPPAIKSDF